MKNLEINKQELINTAENSSLEFIQTPRGEKREDKMTICIAALCNGGRSLVVGADREITVSGISLKFDHNEKKIDQLSPQCVMLASGDALLANEIFFRAKEEIEKDFTIKQIAETVMNVFMQNHAERVERLILKPLGFNNFADWREKAANQVPLAVYQQIHNNIFGFGLNVASFIIAGLDNTGGHIFRVFYEGLVGGNWIEWCDKIGYRAIGSGFSHAFISLSVVGQHAGLNLEDTLYNVYCAKKVAELAPGVGKEDDFASITEKGIEYIEKAKIEEFKERRKEKRAS